MYHMILVPISVSQVTQVHCTRKFGVCAIGRPYHTVDLGYINTAVHSSLGMPCLSNNNISSPRDLIKTKWLITFSPCLLLLLPFFLPLPLLSPPPLLFLLPYPSFLPHHYLPFFSNSLPQLVHLLYLSPSEPELHIQIDNSFR